MVAEVKIQLTSAMAASGVRVKVFPFETSETGCYSSPRGARYRLIIFALPRSVRVNKTYQKNTPRKLSMLHNTQPCI